MTEMAHAGEGHGDAVFVGGGSDFLVAHAAARLDDRRSPGPGNDIYPVAEWEKSIRSDYRTLERQSGTLRL